MVSSAAGHGLVDSGSSGGGNAVLIIVGVAVVFGLFYMGRKRWRGRRAGPDDGHESVNGGAKRGQMAA